MQMVKCAKLKSASVIVLSAHANPSGNLCILFWSRRNGTSLQNSVLVRKLDSTIKSTVLGQKSDQFLSFFPPVV
jgi:hypothetical protein